jgi:hypothetical protein
MVTESLNLHTGDRMFQQPPISYHLRFFGWNLQMWLFYTAVPTIIFYFIFRKYMKFSSIVAKEIKAIKNIALQQPIKLYNEEKDLKHLPPIVQRYLKQVLTNGVKRARLATIKMGGSFKPQPKGSWYPLKNTTEYFGNLQHCI